MAQEITQMARFTAEQLQNVSSFEEAFALAAATSPDGTILEAADTIGDGFTVLENKDELVGMALIVLDWTWAESDYGTGTYFASLRVVTHDGRKLIVNDGGTGIPRQLQQFEGTHGKRPFAVMRGLRKSQYKNEFGEATTYYIDTAKEARR